MLFILFLLLLLTCIDSITLTYLASVQSYVIPQNVFEVNIQAYGGPGGKGNSVSSAGGYGGYMSCNVNVSVGHIGDMYVRVFVICNSPLKLP